MKVHELKTLPVYFEAVLDGSKKVELRKDDRGFKVGDTLLLREWKRFRHPDNEYIWSDGYTGREITVKVTHILRGSPWLADGYIAMSIERREKG